MEPVVLGDPSGRSLALIMLGHGLVIWATAVKSYFSQIARVQTERDHQVIEIGPYRHIRHPAYVGPILVSVGTPLLLGSTWALILGLVAATLMILRTYLEGKMLLAELKGYADYAGRQPIGYCRGYGESSGIGIPS